MCSTDIFLGLLAILFPPLPVWVKCGLCSADSIINILLCCLGYIPGLLHAWYIIAKFPEPPYDYEPLTHDHEGGHITYVYVQPASGHSGERHGGMNYGTQSDGRAPQQQGIAYAGQSGSENAGGVPPSYAEVVAGDNKVQSNS